MVKEKKVSETVKEEVKTVTPPAAPLAAPQQPQLTREQAIQNSFNSSLNLIAREVNLLYQSVTAILNVKPQQPPTVGK